MHTGSVRAGCCPVGAMSSGAPDEPARPGNLARAVRRRQWYLAAEGVAGVALLAGTGAVLVTVSPAPATRPVAEIPRFLCKSG